MASSEFASGAVVLPDVTILKNLNRDLFQLNLGYLMLVREYADRDLVMAKKLFKNIPAVVLERMADLPPQRLAHVARAITTPVLYPGLNESGWNMVLGVMDNELQPAELAEYLLGVMLHER
ncbi:MAG: hypothetical protein AB7F61_19380 [Desulfobulbus sp.]